MYTVVQRRFFQGWATIRQFAVDSHHENYLSKQCSRNEHSAFRKLGQNVAGKTAVGAAEDSSKVTTVTYWFCPWRFCHTGTFYTTVNDWLIMEWNIYYLSQLVTNYLRASSTGISKNTDQSPTQNTNKTQKRKWIFKTISESVKNKRDSYFKEFTVDVVNGMNNFL